MSKIVPLRPGRDPIRPVLMLLTSHRLDCLLLSMRSLQRFTNLGRFKKIYIVANAVEPDHAAILHRFMHTTPGVEVIHCSPRGLVPAVNAVQNEILSNHLDDVVVKMDEDVFVTPLWLEHLLEAYRAHRMRADIPIVSALAPVSPPGRFAMNRFLKAAYPAERAMYEGAVVEENWVYHRWMWEKVVHEDLVGAWLASGQPPYFYPDFATINCVVYDRRLLEAVLPLPVRKETDAPLSDEAAINRVLAANHWRNAVVSRALAHHYSFAKCEQYLRSHVPLDFVWQHLQDLWRAEQARLKGLTLRRYIPAGPMAGASAS
ncbi:hypothetical protein NNJEOMEG_01859 [Fundidesulfovibrio magnetotacticus]|uniref:Glycosyltransferase 2-like domain-containing protein n=1 Tax=Fundidesulfovibrio magnetotacticus TaxID=2730080 RepID=A0A6V8LTV6_9BACT|nr:glycosyltransferase [Fundidesulfovibrio magnetotacticus]GFK94021.1 hypothetical protein NNJEOMEG_01859 [Fundidesulfovibrio magnetotacticus]